MSYGLNIEQFSISDKRINNFAFFPNTILKQYPFWIAPLRMQIKDNFHPTKNPFWQFAQSHFFLASRNGEIVGRIAAIIHPKFNEYHGEQTGFFGFLDAIDDQTVFDALFENCIKWLKQQNINKIIGPFNPSLNYELGVLTKGFEQFPTFMMPYHPSYYDNRILKSGLQKAMDFYAYQLDVVDFAPSSRMIKISKWLKKRYNITFRNLNFSDVKTDAAKVHEVYNQAFQSHFGYTPFELEEVIYMAHELKAIVEKDFFFFIYVNGQLAGFILAIPDLNIAIRHLNDGRLFPFGIFKLLYHSRKIKRVRVLNAAVKYEYKHLGLSSLLYKELQRRIKAKHYTGGELSWVVENNLSMNHGAEEIGGTITKEYRIYEKSF